MLLFVALHSLVCRFQPLQLLRGVFHTHFLFSPVSFSLSLFVGLCAGQSLISGLYIHCLYADVDCSITGKGSYQSISTITISKEITQ